MNKTTGSFFTGGALFDIGAKAAGYTPIWGVEKDDKIASVARRNGFPVLTADVLDLDLSTLERPDHFHASPPCPNFSNAKQDAEETELDIAMADAVCRALTYFKPDTFTLENVVGYRNGQSFKKIMKTLETLGYWYDATNLNAADFGVPQTRSRLWIRASRGLLRGYPETTPWKGWYEAIADLIDELPDSEFAPWQIARLPEDFKAFMAISGKYNPESTRGKIYREPHEPAFTIMTDPRVKAFLIGGGNNSFAEAKIEKGMRYADEPMHTVTSSASPGKTAAFVLTGGNTSNEIIHRDAGEPHPTVIASNRVPYRAHVNGRIVKMNIRALGRFQTVPDWYQGLTVKINGNGVPCLMAQKILETL